MYDVRYKVCYWNKQYVYIYIAQLVQCWTCNELIDLLPYSDNACLNKTLLPHVHNWFKLEKRLDVILGNKYHLRLVYNVCLFSVGDTMLI